MIEEEIIMSEVTRKALIGVSNAFSGFIDENGEWAEGKGEKFALAAILFCILSVSVIGGM